MTRKKGTNYPVTLDPFIIEKPNRAKKYVSFVEVENPGRKTRLWHVVGYKEGDHIGLVKWAGNWRKYVYFIEADSYYDWDCLRLIADFCEAATKDHKNAQEKF